MQSSIDQINDTTVAFHVSGRFDAHDAPKFKDDVAEQLAGGRVNVAVHLTEVTFVDSTALAELVRGMKQARERGGDLTLHQVSDSVRVILELTRLDAAFVLVDSPATASV